MKSMEMSKTGSFMAFLMVILASLFLLNSCQKAQGSENEVIEAAVEEQPIPEVTKKDLSPVQVTDFDNAELEQKLQSLIDSNPVWSSLAKQKKMSVSVLDLSHPNQPRYAAINGDNMMYAASLPKIAILFAAEYSINDGSLELTPELGNDMRLMISKSNNQAATRVLDKVGMKRIEEILRDDQYKFYDESNGGGLWVGKRYSSSGAANRDPLKNLSHAATVNQVAKFYYLLYNRQLISPERSDHMLNMLVDPELTHKFVHNLKKLEPNGKIYRKSGTWQDWHADSAMVTSDDKDFVLVALIKDSRGEQIIRDLTIPLADLVQHK